MKNIVKAVMVAGIPVMLCCSSGLASPINVSVTGTSPPVHQWGGGFDVYVQDFQDIDYVENESGLQTINLEGANSIQVTWNAPAGYMYVVNPPPADFGNQSLRFSMWVQYGQAGQASSLGSVTSQSSSLNLVYGNPSFFGGVTLVNNPNDAGIDPAITANLNTMMGPGSSPFAFTSATVDATFSGTGVSQLLSPNNDGESPATFFAVLFGLPTTYGLYSGPPSDPGLLLTLVPLPTTGGSVPDTTSTLTLAGMSFLGLMLFRRKLLSEKTA